MKSTAFVGALCAYLLPVLTASAQERPAREDDAGPIVVKLTTLVEGRVVDVVDPEKGEEARRVVDRRLRWSVGERECERIEAAGEALALVARDPGSRRADPTTGGVVLAGLRIEPGPNVRWSEVLQTFDAAMRAGFADISVATFGGLLPRAIAAPVVDARDLTVPPVEFCEPDELPPEHRPVVDVRRDGRVAVDGEHLFAPVAGKPDDLARLRAALRRLRADLAEKGEVERRGEGREALLTTPVLLRIDHLTRWRDAQRVLREVTAGEVGFWKLQVAVAEVSVRLR